MTDSAVDFGYDPGIFARTGRRAGGIEENRAWRGGCPRRVWTMNTGKAHE
jgi:hypothetical protein